MRRLRCSTYSTLKRHGVGHERLLGIGCRESYRSLRPERNGEDDPSTLTAMSPSCCGARPPSARAGDDHALRARRRARGRLRRRCGSGRSTTSRASGRRSGSSSTCRPPSPTSACWARARCPAPSGSRARACPTPSTSSAARDDDAVAIRHASELRELAEWTWGELRAQTARIAAGLRALGVGAGDRVVGLHAEHPRDDRRLPGHARRSARSGRARSPDFGARSVIDRFAQIEPKVLLAVDGYRYGGQGLRPPRDRGAGIARRDSLGTRSCRLGYLDGDAAGGRARRRADEPLTFEQVPVRPPAVGALQLGHDRACPSRSCTARAGSCSSTSRRCTCTSTRRPATASSGSRRPAG